MGARIEAGRITGIQAGIPAGPSITGVVAGVQITGDKTGVYAGLTCNAGAPAGKYLTSAPASPSSAGQITGVVACIEAGNTGVILACGACIPACYAGIGAGETRVQTCITGVGTGTQAGVSCYHADHT